jgi:hypothetical protein
MTAAHPITQIAQRLKKLVLLLSSDQDGEVVGAARAIDRALRSAGADWHDLVSQLDRTSTNTSGAADQFRNWRSMRGFCAQRPHLLRPREQEFIDHIDSWCGELTEKQNAWLISIYARVKKLAT